MVSGAGASELLKGGGLRALYSGLWGNLVGVAPASAIFLCVYEPLKKAVCNNIPEDRQFLGPIVAGASAGLAASLVRVPTEVVKQRMQTGAMLGLRMSACICSGWTCDFRALHAECKLLPWAFNSADFNVTSSLRGEWFRKHTEARIQTSRAFCLFVLESALLEHCSNL